MIIIRRPPFQQHCHLPKSSLHCRYGPKVILFRSPEHEKTKSPPVHSQKEAALPVLEHSKPVVFQGHNMQLIESKGKLSLNLDLPGVKLADLQVETLNDCFHVNAKRRSGNEVKSISSQEFIVDAVTTDFSNMKADFSDGVLTIELPKKKAPKPADIPIIAQYPPEDHSDEDLDLSLDLPGVKAAEIKATFTGRLIVLQAKRNRGGLVSCVDRRLQMDPDRFDTSKLQAYLADGVLTIHAPHRVAPTPTKIHVSASNSPHQPDQENNELQKGSVVKSVENAKDDASKQPSQDKKIGHEKEEEKEDVVVETVEEPDAEEEDKEWEHVRE